MNKFIISIDSACDGNKDELAKLGVNVINYHYYDDNTDYLDNMESTNAISFYQNMRNGTKYHTSQLNQFAYYEFFKEQLNTNKNIIHISLSEGLSGSINQARVAAKELKEEYQDINIEIIDSLIASNGELVLLDKALELQKEGVDIFEASDLLAKYATEINTYYTTDTLTYFVRGGRLPKVAGIVGSVLRINPVLTCNSIGNLKVDKQLRGKKNAIRYILEKVKSSVTNLEEQEVYVCHADNIEGAKELGELLKNEIGFKGYKLYTMGPIIGAHAGPGLLAIFYHGKMRENKK